MENSERYIGIDVGAETVKLVELRREGGALRWARRQVLEHAKEPGRVLVEALADWGWDEVRAAAVTGRLSRMVTLPRVPQKQALAAGCRHLLGEKPATLVSIGAHGFCVLELRQSGVEVYRENSRCSQGTGNFLRQLVERFGLSLEEASQMAARVEKPAPLSGRCPVILKTDMTHLANKGEDRARILAGLFDAVCDNVQVLIKPRVSPPTLVLTGGVSRAPRVQDCFRRFAARHELTVADVDPEDSVYLEALGAAKSAAEHPAWIPARHRLIAPPPPAHLETVPSLSGSLHQVRRMSAPPISPEGTGPLVVGLDIGSTGSKAVAVDAETRAIAWEGYLRTGGDPVGASQSLIRQLLQSPSGKRPVVALGTTGSGREIVGSLMTVCFGPEAVCILNEIAAHAEGALHYDRRVDTIFEIGGQDAKYIRLADGRVVDSAMNEACSAGTGSFIEEQGKRFAGIQDVTQLGSEALSACSGVSLGQHCSVFMAEIIDEAVAAGVERPSIVAGVYDSIIQNYLNRVKGSRSVGQVVFCQGMPFSADALAAAVARQTGCEVVVPPNPGTVGALGIALLALKETRAERAPGLALHRYLDAKVEKKDTFVCNSTQGCGEPGNKCRVDRMSTAVGGERQRFTWGGGCALYDKGTRKRKLPDLTPDPFREREAMLRRLVGALTASRGRPTIGMCEEFNLKGLLPFFGTFLRELGFDPVIHTGMDRKDLKRGIEAANIPFCAPMQLFHGAVGALADGKPDHLFLPMLRGAPRTADEAHSTQCPIVQGSADILRHDLGPALASKIVSPIIDLGPENLSSEAFLDGCRRLAAELGVERGFERAHQLALAAQEAFDRECLELGRRALAFCAERDLTPVVVLGRPYTIHNEVLNSNVPALLREQGAVAIPIDCYPLGEGIPVFQDVFWGHGQRTLRAAHQIRANERLYSVFCSNYSCGPDSFVSHFYAYIMEGKPFAVIETDGHAGDAGTKTRIEAFLHCVREDQARTTERKQAHSLKAVELDKEGLLEIRRNKERVLIPRMGPGAEVLAASLRGIGIGAEALPMPDREAVAMGRRHTSGKECLPMSVTLGSLLQRVERDRDTDERFSFFMPTSRGPCRFGAYQLLHKLVLRRLGLSDRVHLWSPSDAGYFDQVPSGFAALVFSGLTAADLLLEGLYDARPVERVPGAAAEIHARWERRLWDLLEQAGEGDLSLPAALLEVTSGRLFGVRELLVQAAEELASIKQPKELPTVLVVGEIYVRCDPFSNDFVIDKLEQRGIRCRFAPFTEWFEYVDYVNRREGDLTSFGQRLSSFVQRRIRDLCHEPVSSILGWPERTTVEDSVCAAAPYLREELRVESVLTMGGPVHEWREGHIDAVVSVGPLECMPNKIAESQFFHVAEREGLLSLTLALNGDPVDSQIVDNFAFEVHERFRARTQKGVVTRAELLKRSKKSREAAEEKAEHRRTA